MHITPNEQDLLKSVEEFHALFSDGEGIVHSSSAAMLLHQHLTAAGFRTSFAINDISAVVAAISAEDAHSAECLMDLVEECLEDLAAFNRSTHAAGFTIHRVATPQVDNRQAMIVEFVNADREATRSSSPLILPKELTCASSVIDFDDDLDGIDLF